MKPLIIVESFTKTKTISKYLDNKFNVICSLGHINNLPKDNIGINTDTWQGTYIPTNTKIIKNIKDHVKQTNTIYIASDPDMEGEAIAHHIYKTISSLIRDKVCNRIVFQEITKPAIINAINNPRNIDQDIVNAQETRRFVDRLVGYKLSPLLWNKFNNNTLSVGRVQSVALLMCVDIFQKLKEHVIESHWNLIGHYISNGSKFEFKLYDSDNLFKTSDKNVIISLLDYFNFDEKFKLSIKESYTKENPSAPYTTTSLQQDAYTKYKFSSKKTMQLAQELYENGFITYMRTDSTNISNDFKNKIIKYVRDNYGESNVQFRNHKNNIANAQAAHEAIRVTDVMCANLQNLQSIDNHNDQSKLYNLIWKRTIASQMKNAQYTNVNVYLQYKYNDINEHNYIFVHKKALLTEPGYLRIYDSAIENVEEYKKKFSSKMVADKFVCEANTNTIPSLYNEISLIKALEKEGIGRPSTYSSIVEKIVSKKYVLKGPNPQQDIILKNIVKSRTSIKEIDHKIKIGGQNKDLLVPTELGINIVEYLKKEISFILDIKFTSNMEAIMDKICDKDTTKEAVLNDFYNNYMLPLIPKTSYRSDYAKKEMQTGIINTKYGYCYYNADTKKYTNIESYLKWKKKNVNELTNNEIIFIASLPKLLDDGTELHIGQYGLYLKHNNTNIKLDKSKWDSFISL